MSGARRGPRAARRSDWLAPRGKAAPQVAAPHAQGGRGARDAHRTSPAGRRCRRSRHRDHSPPARSADRDLRARPARLLPVPRSPAPAIAHSRAGPRRGRGLLRLPRVPLRDRVSDLARGPRAKRWPRVSHPTARSKDASMATGTPRAPGWEAGAGSLRAWTWDLPPSPASQETTPRRRPRGAVAPGSAVPASLRKTAVPASDSGHTSPRRTGEGRTG